MDIVEKNLTIIANCISNNVYKEVETERFELKDLSSGWGDDWYKSVCSFLNTNGGIIVIGINDKNNSKPKHYKYTGYSNSEKNESHLKQDLPRIFTDKDGKTLDLSSHIYKFEIRDFLEGKVAVVYIEELPDDEKYVYYKGVAYRRKLTGDHELSTAEIEEYEELKKEIIRNQELSIVKNATLNLIDIDKLNQYILRFNKGKKKGETLKATLENALSFLNRENFVRDNNPTLLGMLVCGNEVEHFIQGQCESDCYVVVPKAAAVAQSKEIFNDNIENLIESSFNFVWRNIQVGVSYAKSGTAFPEYPEELIRECINNAFAHRDYKTDRFVIIEIRPNESLMIRNPGSFERRQRINLDSEFGKIRRIIPIQVARNPKLTHLLKSFDYWEGKGRGLTSLIDTCLDNQIDVPYYILTDGEIRLFIPKGKVYDDAMEFWLNSFTKYIYHKMNRPINEDEKIILSFFRKSEMLNRVENYTILLTMDNNHKEVIATLEEKGLIFKNPQSSDIYPIYQLDRELIKDDFSKELDSTFGNSWNTLKSDYKEVLNAIYWHNTYSFESESVSANSIGAFIYLKINKQVRDISDYENFKRKIRGIFNQLENKGFIIRKDGKTKFESGKPDFKINNSYAKPNTLF
ncbi:MAG: RNA-binding domain-containing protein [Paludibacter sp.]